MIETVVSVTLPVEETLEIKKQRILPLGYEESRAGGQKDTGSCVDAAAQGLKRISIVTGIHGDELEGQFVCYELTKRIKENIENLKAIVDIYPALNPLGIDSITRGFPAFELDMNRIFPGSEDGSMAEHVAARIISDLQGSDACIDIHASNIFLREVPQIRVSEQTAEKLLPLAGCLNMDFVWVHSSATVLQSTLAHTLNSLGTPTFVVEMGVGMRITQNYGHQLVDGILCLMKEMGLWSGDVITPRRPILSQDPEDVYFINASESGIFIPKVSHCAFLAKGDILGEIVDPLSGKLLEQIPCPCDGVVFTIREYPVVNEGSLIARILAMSAEESAEYEAVHREVQP